MEYSERLWVPVSWWAIGLSIGLSFVLAVSVLIDLAVAVGAVLVTAAGLAGTLLWWGRVRIVVDQTGLRAGKAVLEWPWLGEVTALDASGTADRLGPGADHAAHHVVRSYVATSVSVAVADAEDPHPSWLVSTRHPDELVAAIERVRATIRR